MTGGMIERRQKAIATIVAAGAEMKTVRGCRALVAKDVEIFAAGFSCGGAEQRTSADCIYVMLTAAAGAPNPVEYLRRAVQDRLFGS